MRQTSHKKLPWSFRPVFSYRLNWLASTSHRDLTEIQGVRTCPVRSEVTNSPDCKVFFVRRPNASIWSRVRLRLRTGYSSWKPLKMPANGQVSHMALAGEIRDTACVTDVCEDEGPAPTTRLSGPWQPVKGRWLKSDSKQTTDDMPSIQHYARRYLSLDSKGIWSESLVIGSQWVTDQRCLARWALGA